MTSTALARALARPDRNVRVRPVGSASDDAAVAALFDDTVLLGTPFDTMPAGFDAYRDVCLGWYLGPGRRNAALAVDGDGAPVGYALVCTDEAAANRWSARASGRLVLAVASAAARRRLDPAGRRFYRSRVRDVGRLARARTAPPAAAHAHVNVATGFRSGSATIALVAHVDDVCRRSGHRTWYGEMNERPGRRLRALERLGLEVVGTAPNRTLSAVLGEPVVRLTLLRRVPDDAQ